MGEMDHFTVTSSVTRPLNESELELTFDTEKKRSGVCVKASQIQPLLYSKAW